MNRKFTIEMENQFAKLFIDGLPVKEICAIMSIDLRQANHIRARLGKSGAIPSSASRKRFRPDEIKLATSVRVYPSDRDLIESRHGSLQSFFDSIVKEELLKLPSEGEDAD